MLHNHEYDPNCKYCCDNPFVKDAQETQKELEKDKVVVRKLLSEISDQSNLIDTLDKAKEKFEFLISQQQVLEKAQQEKTTGRVLYYEAKEKKERRAKQIKQYAEIKMMKGHSEEQALKMAEEQITTKEW